MRGLRGTDGAATLLCFVRSVEMSGPVDVYERVPSG